MPKPNTAHPRCLNRDCSGGVVNTDDRGGRDCPVCSQLRRRDDLESKGQGPPTRRSLALRLAAHFDEQGKHSWADRMRRAAESDSPDVSEEEAL